jgi:hypothetical protein
MPLRPRIPNGCVFVVAGRVARVRPRPAGGWQVRLNDTGGALAVAEIRSSNPLPLPPRGACVIVRGAVVYDPVHAWYAVDPVDAWAVVPPSESGLLPARHGAR